MAPLHVMHYNDSNLEEEKDWALFAKHLDEANTIGVDAISVDVWWGFVEKQTMFSIGLIISKYLI